MPRVLISSCCPSWPLLRQTSGSVGVWEDFEFFFSQSREDVDACVVLENPMAPVEVNCSPQNTFFVSWEPPEIRTYHGSFLNQFRWVQTCHDVAHAGKIASQQAHPWHLGVDVDRGFVPVRDYDSLKAMQMPEKTGLISVAISNKAVTPAHRQRLRFVDLLKERLGDDLHIYGRGHHPIADKWEAIGRYRFHVVLENAFHANFITEKLTDAFLGYSFPFYYGAPNAEDYFDATSFERVDIFQPEDAIETICNGIDSSLDRLRRDEIHEARRVVLDELNLFPMLVRLLRERMVCGAKQRLTLYPKKQRVRIGVSNFVRKISAAA